MIPPLSSKTATQNPQFASLYSQLTTEILNPDCSTASRFPAKTRQTISSSDDGATQLGRDGRRVGAAHKAGGARPAGPSRAHSQREELWNRLWRSRSRHAKREIVLRALRHAATTTGDADVDTGDVGDEDEKRKMMVQPGLGPGTVKAVSLSQDVRDLMVTLSLVIEHLASDARTSPLSTYEVDLLTQEFADDLDEYMPAISSAVGQEICREHDFLVFVVDPAVTKRVLSRPSTTSTTTRSRGRTTTAPSTTTPPLHTLLTPHLTHLTTLTTTLAPLLSSPLLLHPLPPLLSLHTSLLTSTLRTLELHTHGTLTRHLKSRTTHLSTVSSGLALKPAVLRSRLESSLFAPDPSVQVAMTRYSRVLDAEVEKVGDLKSEVEGALREYDDDDDNVVEEEEEPRDGSSRSRSNNNKSSILRDIGRRYAALIAEESSLKQEIARLASSSSSSSFSDTATAAVRRLIV